MARGPIPSDTIAALSTAVGRGATAVVRLSGPEAVEVLLLVAPELPEVPAPRRARFARIIHPEDSTVVDQAVVTVFRAPESYTGEDVVEISGHGGWLAPSLVLDACLAAGAREAEPGEFTRRAFLNGKLDLVQAEAVLDLVEGRSRALHSAAVHQLDRGLSMRIGRLREALIGLEALLVHHIDFPEEDDAPVSVDAIGGEAGTLLEALDDLLATAPEGELLREGALTVLAGRPNSGKSSLFNALLGEERAIVTEVPGTTRDALEAVVTLGGFPFRIVDTAGVRKGGERVERVGIEVARRYVARADLVLLCVPAAEAWSAADAEFVAGGLECPVVVLRTKADLAVEMAPPAGGVARPAGRLSVSALTGEGLDGMRELLPKLVYEGLVRAEGRAPVLTRRRQSRAVRRARDEVAEFRRALTEIGLPPEVASAHLKEAASALEEVVGGVSTEDVLDQVFRQFCIGK